METLPTARKPWPRLRRAVRHRAASLRAGAEAALVDATLGALNVACDVVGGALNAYASGRDGLRARRAVRAREADAARAAEVAARRDPRRPDGARPLTPELGEAGRGRRWALDRCREGVPAAVAAAPRRLRRRWTSAQAQSPLFTRLPPEIRARVFTEALRGHFLQLVGTPAGSLRGVVCRRGPRCSPGCEVRHSLECVMHTLYWYWPWERGIPDEFPGSFWPEERTARGGMLALLRTCRRV
jgi:hypothetical protein